MTTKADKKLEYQDNTDRIEVEREFSVDKRCYGMNFKCKNCRVKPNLGLISRHYLRAGHLCSDLPLIKPISY